MSATQLTARKVIIALFAMLVAFTGALAQAGPEPLPLPLRRSYDEAKFIDMAHGYVFGSSEATAIIATEDGGAGWRLVKDVTLSTWDVPLLPQQRVLKISTVAFADADHFWVLMSRCALLRTSDGGRNFKVSQIRYVNKNGGDTPQMCGGLAFLNQSEGWIAAGSLLLHTTDEGEHWESAPLPQGAKWLWQIWMFSDRTGLATGDGVIITDNGGQSWRAVQSAPDLSDAELSCSASGFCAALTAPRGPVLISQDRGLSWRDSHVALKPGRQDEIHGVHAFGVDHIVVVGGDGGFDYDLMVRGKTGPELSQVNLPAERGLILRWAGNRWTRITHEDPKEFFGAYFVDENNGWLFADNNRIYKTTDGGHTFEFVADYFRQRAARTPSPGPLPTPAP